MAIKTCVSLYSLQDEYMNKRMTLEDIMKYLAENKVEGLELLPDQMIHNTPHPSEESLKHWDYLMETYKTSLFRCIFKYKFVQQPDVNKKGVYRPSH